MNNDEINLQYTIVRNPVPDFIYNNLKVFSKNSNSYHEQPIELRSKLANKHNIPIEYIYLVSGIDEAIQHFAYTYGKNTTIFTPSYISYHDVEYYGGTLNQKYSILDNEFRISTATQQDATLIFLPNPNNPCGITPPDKIEELVKNNSKAIIAVDEAYGMYADVSAIDKVQENKNLVVFRSFSKDYGLAGMRIGYCIAHPKIIEKVFTKLDSQWINISYLSVGAAIIALENEEYFQSMRNEIIDQQRAFGIFLSELGFNIIPSYLNAVLLKFPSESDADVFVNYLKSNNIVVSHGNGNSNIGLDQTFVRIAIGTSDQMSRAREVIKKYFN